MTRYPRLAVRTRNTHSAVASPDTAHTAPTRVAASVAQQDTKVILLCATITCSVALLQRTRDRGRIVGHSTRSAFVLVWVVARWHMRMGTRSRGRLCMHGGAGTQALAVDTLTSRMKTSHACALVVPKLEQCTVRVVAAVSVARRSASVARRVSFLLKQELQPLAVFSCVVDTVRCCDTAIRVVGCPVDGISVCIFVSRWMLLWRVLSVACTPCWTLTPLHPQ